MGKVLAPIAYLVAIVAGCFQIYGYLAEWGFVQKPQGRYAVQRQTQRPQPTTTPAVAEVSAPQQPVASATPLAPRPVPPLVQAPTRTTQQPAARPVTVTSLRSAHSNIATEVEFVNESGPPVRIFWVDHEGRERCYYGLAPGESYTQRTYATHPWRVRDYFGGELRAEIVAAASPRRVTIRQRPGELPIIWPLWMPVTCGNGQS